MADTFHGPSYRTRLKKTARFFAPALLLLLFVGPVAAQVNSTDLTTASGIAPGSPAGSFALSDLESINLYNGNLNFKLPLLRVGGRGSAGYDVTLALNVKGWRVQKIYDRVNDAYKFRPNKNWWSISAGFGPGVLAGRQMGVDYGAYTCYRDAHGNPLAWPRNGITTLTFAAPDGTEYELRDKDTNGKPLPETSCFNGASRGTVFVTADGTSMTFVSDAPIRDQVLKTAQTIYPSGHLLMRDGTRYRIDNGLVTWIRDRNGNKVSFAYDTNRRLATVTDQLNRRVTITGSDTQTLINYSGFGGAPRTISVNYTSLGNALRPNSGYAVQTYGQLFPELYNSGPPDSSAGLTNNPAVVSSVTLPDGVRQYQFFYNSYGEVARVVLPTGGAIEYDMMLGSGVVSYGSDDYEIYRRVAERRVYPDGGSGGAFEGRTAYTASASAPGSDRPWYSDVTVDHFDRGGARLAREKHYFYGSGVASLFKFFDAPNARETYSVWNEGREYQTEALDPSGEGTTVLRRVNNTWRQREPVAWWTGSPDLAPSNDPRLVETVTTLVDTNQVSKQTSINPADGSVGFDQFNNQTDIWDYDFGEPGTGSPGAFIRRTHTDYLTDASYVNGGAAPAQGAHLRSLPLRQWVSSDTDGINKEALTEYEFDDYTATANHTHEALTARPAISGLCTTFSAGGGRCDDPSDPTKDPAAYHTRGNVTASTRFLLSGGVVTGSVTSYRQYDVAGNVVAAINPRGRDATDARAYATTFDFGDSFGSPDAEAQSNTPPTELLSQGQVSYAFATKVTNPLGHTAFTQYDYYLGRPVNSEDANGTVSSVSYDDPLDRPTKAERAVNVSTLRSQTTFGYDDANRVITTTGDLNALNDNLLKSQALYDGLGRTVESRIYETAAAHITTLTTYDALGRIKRTYNPFRTAADSTYGWAEMTYDSLSRAVRVETFDRDGASTGALQSAYSGNRVLVTDQAGKQRLSQTDALGRLKGVWEIRPADASTVAVSFPGHPEVAAGYRTAYGYDALGNLLTVTQGVQPRSFVYDSLSRLVLARNPEQEATLSDGRAAGLWSLAYEYDANGNLKRRTDARAIRTEYTYDALDRVTLRDYSDSTPDVAYGYDDPAVINSRGRLTSVSTPASGFSYSYTGYDALGRVTGSAQTTAGVTYPMLDYRYDLAGNLTSQQYPSGKVVTTDYDAAGRVAGVRREGGDYYAGAAATDGNGQPHPDRLRYSAHGAVEALRFGNGLWETTDFNDRLQTEWIKLGTAAGGADRWRLDYGYGPEGENNGNVRSQAITVPAVGAAAGFSAAQTYTYDPLNRLEVAFETGGSLVSWRQHFTYDRFGNRRLDPSDTTPELVGPNPAIDPATNRLTGAGYSYDAAGNLTASPTASGSDSYAYDGENRLVLFNGGASMNGGAAYGYDGEGRRVEKVAGVVKTVFVYDVQGQLVAEYSSEAAQANGTQYVTQDALGSTRVVTGAGGAVKSRHDYLPYGEEVGLRGGRTGETDAATGGEGQHYRSGGMRQKFTGYERDNETKLDFAQNRYYSSAQGRFTSVDPENAGANPGAPQSWNGYAYALNNPTIFVDPDGLKVVICDLNGACGELSDPDANRYFFNREYQRANGYYVRRGKVFDTEGNQIGTYENQCCDDLPERNSAILNLTGELLRDPATWFRAAALGVLGAVTKNVPQRAAQRVNPRRIGRYGHEGSPSVRQAVEQISSPGTHRQIGGRVPTRDEAEQLIHQAGGSIDRVERAHRGRGHNFDHINYTTSDGQKATVEVQSVGRQFYRDSRPKN